MRTMRCAGSISVCVLIAVTTTVAAAGPAGAEGDDSSLCAEMPDAVGLYEGNPVTQMGFKVGTIASITPVDDHVRVDFTLDVDRPLPADVKALTRSTSLLADRSLELVGNYESGDKLTSAQCITLTNGFTPKTISEITGSAADFIEAVAPVGDGPKVEEAIEGLDNALAGTGPRGATLMTSLSSALNAPDQMIRDFGTSIENMAPLTSEALANWDTIRSILTQAPFIVGNAHRELMPGVLDLQEGTGYVVNLTYDIQRRYGGDIWPVVQGPVVDLIRLAATRSDDIAGLISSVPSLAAVMRQQATPSGMTLTYNPPTVRLPAPDLSALCGPVGGPSSPVCSSIAGALGGSDINLFDLVLRGGAS